MDDKGEILHIGQTDGGAAQLAEAQHKLLEQIVVTPESEEQASQEQSSVEPTDMEPTEDEWLELEEGAERGYRQLAQFIRQTEGAEPIPRELYPHIEAMAKAWQVAHRRFMYVFHHPDEVEHWSWQEEIWDKRAMDTNHYMNALLDPDEVLRYTQLFEPKTGTHEENPSVDTASSPRAEHVSELIHAQGFKEKAALAEFATYDLWLHYRYKILSATGHQSSLREYEQAHQRDVPLITGALTTLAQQDDYKSVRAILEDLEYIGESACARDVLFDPNLTHTQRQGYMIQYINVFGFIPTVDTISSKLKQLRTEAREDDGTALHNRLYIDLRILFGLIQGEAVEKVLTELTEVYEAVDFAQYALNSADLTEREAARIKTIVQQFAERHEIEPHQVRILDVGAGTGRHLRELYEAGYMQLIALEQEHKHIEQIKDTVPGARIIEASWDNIPLPDGGFLGDSDSAPQVFYCLGRTLLHNRTPPDMLRFFDELQRITDYEAIGLVDIPDIDIGVYEGRVRSFSDNLNSLEGIDGHQAQLIFDGPDAVHKFNRMTLTDEQLKAYARLCGFKVVQLASESVGEDDEVRNLYFQLVKDGDYYPGDITRDELSKMLKTVGLYDSGVDYSIYVDAWGMTLGQALLYGLDNDDIRTRNNQGEPPSVFVEKRGRTLYFEGSMRV